MSKSSQNAKVSANTNEKNNQNVTSLAIIPEQKEKDENAHSFVASDYKSQNKNGLNIEKGKKDQSAQEKPIQRENIRYY
jgi:hypothetical protein